MSTIPNTAVARTDLEQLSLVARGKVRDIYSLGDDYLLLVATDRLSAYDVVLPDPIPGKRASCSPPCPTSGSQKTAHVCANQTTERALHDVIDDSDLCEILAGRARIVHRTTPLPIEAVVRGYLAGSGWKDYCNTGAVCGIALPDGLAEAARLPMPVFTPATKAAVGDHDENIGFAAASELIGAELAAEVRRISLALYALATAHAEARGIIIADTKFEFGLDATGRLTLIDEVLTPDSSRFWPMADYRTGMSPPSFDKQFVRDYLTESGWNREPPGPALPADVIARTRERYIEALERMTA